MSRRISIEKIRELAIQKGLSLQSTSYINHKQRLTFRCPKHGIVYKTYKLLKKTHGCPKCGYKIGSQKQTLKIETVKENILDMGYTPIFAEYRNAHQKLLVNCKKHGNFEISYTNLKSGKRCRKCGYEKIANINKLSYEEIVDRISTTECKLGFTKETYKKIKDTKTQVSLVCKKHGIFSITLDNFWNSKVCQKCSKGVSKDQKEIYDFIKNYYPNALYNARNIIGKKELDIYIPEIKVAIEYCGLIWHSEQFKDDQNYHINKLQLCNSIGIQLITIFEDEWLRKKTLIKNFLLSTFNKNSVRIGARQTTVKQIDKKEARDFLLSNHLQGYSNSEICFGLYYKNDLVGIMSGNKHHRQIHKKEKELVLNRLAFKEGISVRGGSSKLLKQLIFYCQNRNYGKLISWSDNRWSEGNVYKKLGFVMTEELKPDYSYVKKHMRFSKQSCQKRFLIKKGATGQTEREMAMSLSLYRIYDCGKKRWEISINNNYKPMK